MQGRRRGFGGWGRSTLTLNTKADTGPSGGRPRRRSLARTEPQSREGFFSKRGFPSVDGDTSPFKLNESVMPQGTSLVNEENPLTANFLIRLYGDERRSAPAMRLDGVKPFYERVGHL